MCLAFGEENKMIMFLQDSTVSLTPELSWFIICIYFTFQQQDMVKGESVKLVQQSARLVELENETDIQLNSCTSPILIN